MGQIKNYSGVHFGRFEYSPFSYFGTKNLAIKKNAIVFGNWWKVANYTGCQPFSAFLAIFEGPSRHTDSTFSNKLKKLVKLCGLRIAFFSLKINTMLAGKSWFSDCWSFSYTLNKFECLTTRAFLTILKVPEEKLMPPSQISF